MNRKTTMTTIEIDQLMIVRRRSGSFQRDLCRECATEVMLVKPEEAAALIGVSSREIHRLIEAGRVHFRERPEGSILICVRSLAEHSSSSASQTEIQFETKTRRSQNE